MQDLQSVFLTDNPYFTAGFGLIGVGAGLTLFRQGATRLAFLLQRRYLTSLEIASKDPSYYWMLQWISKNNLRTGNHFSVQTIRLGDDSKSKTLWKFVPSPGVHYMKWGRNWIKVQREREKSAMMDITTGNPFETIKLTMIGRDMTPFYQIITEAQGEAHKMSVGKLVLYTSFANEWRPFGQPRQRRDINSVVLDDGISDNILTDLREFLSSSKWYSHRGIPYRRGYLLHGPPGTGKSSFVQAIASELGYSICLLNLADGTITDDRLSHLLSALPEQALLLIEDIDAISTSDNRTPHQGFSRLTLSGLLNALDGVGSSEERIIFMTTNHHERLDPALIRPGRIDVQYCIDRASPSQTHRMFMRFYPDNNELADAFVAKLQGYPISPASIQGHFIKHKDSPKDSVIYASLLLPTKEAEIDV